MFLLLDYSGPYTGIVMIKLNIEQRDALFELTDSEGYKVLVEHVLPQLLDQEATKVLHLRLDNLNDSHTLAIELANYQGAKALIGKLATLKDYLKKPSGNKRT